MRRLAPPLFLERESYRHRRLTDAVRLLPALGFVLFLLPLLWTRPATATGMVYLFMVWSLLVVISFCLSRRIDPHDPAESATGPLPGGSEEASDDVSGAGVGVDGVTGEASAVMRGNGNGGR